MTRLHIIAAKLPSGDQLASARSTALDDRAKSSNSFDETRRGILARLNADDRADFYRDEPEGTNELLAEWRGSLDADLRIIGYGMLFAYLYVVVFRIAQVWS